MRPRRTSLTLLLIAAAAAGCIPEKRVVWSPDGRHAGVATPNGLFLIDSEGTVLKPRLTGSSTKCDWFPDSRRLAVVHAIEAESWEDIADLFDAAQVREIKQVGNTLRERVLAYEGDWDAFEVDTDNTLSSAVELAASIYVRDHLSEGLPEKLGEKWDDLKELRPEVWHLQIFTISADGLVPGKVLLRTLSGINQPKVAPTGKQVALLTGGGPDDAPGLCVVPASGGKLRRVAEYVALDFDWSPDGHSLAYIHTIGPIDDSDHIRLGSLATIRIASPDGALLKDWEERNVKVGLLFDQTLAVRWLSNDRLLFSTAEVTLPATAHDMPRQWALFMLDLNMPTSVLRVLRRDFGEDLEPSLPLFDVSPDEKRVLLLGSKRRAILYEFATGETHMLVPGEIADRAEIKCLPTWRNNSQICFVKPGKDQSGEDEVLLWDGGKTKLLSGTWPSEMKEGWLINK